MTSGDRESAISQALTGAKTIIPPEQNRYSQQILFVLKSSARSATHHPSTNHIISCCCSSKTSEIRYLTIYKTKSKMTKFQTSHLTAPTSWIVIQIPVDKIISDSKSEEGKKWLEIIKPLAKESQPGFEHGVWGRLIEQPEEVWLITGWKTFEAIQKFEESDIHEGQLKVMRELSGGKEPIITHAGLSGDFWNMLTDYTGMMDIYFPDNIEDETEKRINDLKGLIYSFAPGKRSGKSAYNGKALKGWVNESVEFEEKQTRVLRYLHYWNSKEGEEEFKAEAGFFTEAGEWKNIFSEWVASLEEEGMLGIKEVHCKFETIPWKFWDYTSEEEREMAEIDAGSR